MKVNMNRIDLRWKREGPCVCGSDETVLTAYDSKGIPLTMGCAKCLPHKLKGYRTDVLYGPDYETEEQIEEDY